MRSRAVRRSVSSAGRMAALVIGTDMAAGSGLLPLPEGERGGVRGFGRLLVERVQNLFEHAVRISHHVIVPKPEDEIPACFQISRSVCILLNTVGMLPAINLHNEPCVRAAKIYDEAIERHLPAKLPSAEPALAQAEPQDSLCIRLLSAQSPCHCRIV
jgi:hypothetical protein